jgi:ABC-type glycerol-3-phosphate transport system substrate-binding protein
MGIGAATIGSGALLAACAPSSSGDSDPKTLNLMIPSWVDPKFISDVMQGSAAGAIGAKINLITTDDGTYPAQAAAAQKAGQSPDLLMWTAQGIPAFQAAGVKLAGLDDYVKDENKADFYQQDYDANSIDGTLYGLGYRADCRGIVYNSSFGGADVPESWTLDEFGEWAAGLKGSGHDAFGFEAKPGDGRASSNVLPLFWSTGKPFVTKNGDKWEVGFTAEDIEPIMKFYFDTVHTWGLTPSEVANWGYQETDSKFAQGSLASYSAGPFVIANTQEFPDTAKAMKLAPLPQVSQPANFWEELSFMIHADSKKADLAWEFIQAMRSVDVQAEIVSRTSDAWLGVRPAANDTISDPFLKSFGPLLAQAVVPEPLNVAPAFNDAILPTLGDIALNKTQPAAAAESLVKLMSTALANQ